MIVYGREYFGGGRTVEGSGLLDINHFTEGMAPFRAADKKFGLITSGKPVIKAQFEGVGYFSDGVAWAKTADDKVGYVDKSGAWVIKPQFEVAKKTLMKRPGWRGLRVAKTGYTLPRIYPVTHGTIFMKTSLSDWCVDARTGKFGWLNGKRGVGDQAAV